MKQLLKRAIWNHPDALVSVGRLCEGLGRFHAAHTCYERALSLAAGTWNQTRLRDVTARLEKSSVAAKNKSELEFWLRARVEHGGDLRKTHTHYGYFYTTYFGLSRDFYRGKKVLDIGCGPAGSLEWADEAAERVGVDPLADEYLTKLNAVAHKMRYVAARSESIPFPDGHFDVVCSFNSLDHVDDLDKTVAEITRLVAPGGYFLLLTELHPEPTIEEPVVFSWDVTRKFQPAFALLEEKHFEKHALGIYQSLWGEIGSVVPFDHENPTPRYGVLSAKFVKTT